MKLYRIGIIISVVLVVKVQGDRRRVFEEQLASMVGKLKTKDDDASMQSLNRMLLAFRALGELKEIDTVFNHSDWRDSLLNTQQIDYSNLTSADNDATDRVLNAKLNFVKNVDSVVSGELTLKEAAAGQIASLAQYLHAMIEKETRFLECTSEGKLYDDVRAQSAKTTDSAALFQLLTEIRERLCTPYVFLPRQSTDRRVIINGPSLEITLSTGACEGRLDFNQTSNLPQQRISCTGHEISYTKSPISLHRQLFLPEVFTTSQCKVERRFGTPTERVVYGGGSVVRFDSIDDLIDALNTKESEIFVGISDLFNTDLAAQTNKDQSKDTSKLSADFWSILGPGRLLNMNKPFDARTLKTTPFSEMTDLNRSPAGFD